MQFHSTSVFFPRSNIAVHLFLINNIDHF